MAFRKGTLGILVTLLAGKGRRPLLGWPGLGTRLRKITYRGQQYSLIAMVSGGSLAVTSYLVPGTLQSRLFYKRFEYSDSRVFSYLFACSLL